MATAAPVRVGPPPSANGHHHSASDICNRLRESIPAELQNLRQWVFWRTVDGVKVPFKNAVDKASTDDRATWSGFQLALDQYRLSLNADTPFSGIGFVFTISDEYVGIDIDKCRNKETGEIAAWGMELISKLNSYAEVSPSGTGVKVWVKGDLPLGIGANGKPKTGKKVPHQTGAVEMYRCGRYFTMTGNRLEGCPATIESRPEEISWLWNKAFVEPQKQARLRGAVPHSNFQFNGTHSEAVDRARKYLAKLPTAISGKGGHNQTFRAACVLVEGFNLSPDEAYPILDEWNSKCEPPWSDYELRHKLEDADAAAENHGYLLNEPPPEKPQQPRNGKPVAGSQFLPIESGTKIRCKSRGNLGTVVSDRGDSCDVHFVAEDGNQATVPIPKADLQRADGKPVAVVDVQPINSNILVIDNPKLRRPVIDRLLRAGEVGNIIAPPKFGKSWLIYCLIMAMAAGAEWLGRFKCTLGRVLLIDNELHPSTLAARLQSTGRHYEEASADLSENGIVYGEWYGSQLDILPLRGRLMDLHQIAAAVGQISPGTYDLIILDAWYRALPAGVNENDNGQIAQLYNLLDATAERLDAAWLNVHHASKGGQGEKSVTDVGAGAGAQSRAADAHIVLRPHETDGVVVLETVVRSFPPVEPVSLRFNFPVWSPAPDVDPRLVRGRSVKKEEQRQARDESGLSEILEILRSKGKPVRAKELRSLAGGMKKDRCDRLCYLLEKDGQIVSREIRVRGQETVEFSLVTSAGNE